MCQPLAPVYVSATHYDTFLACWPHLCDEKPAASRVAGGQKRGRRPAVLAGARRRPGPASGCRWEAGAQAAAGRLVSGG